ncbi:MAG: hypothetical protein KKD18_07095 [Nanoarchaeota archaeon]|nr:hypothetical protein [Nanoarchaeota archaeon]MBU0978158.1 hypothetical protein [Nanoarchaeota archaeon]
MEIEGEILGFVLIFLVVCAGFYFFIIRDNGPEDVTPPAVQNDSGEIANEAVNNSTIGGGEDGQTMENETVEVVPFQNITELHWDHMPLTYKYVNNASKCEGFPVERMKDAFSIIEAESGNKVEFTEVIGNITADVDVTCVDYQEILQKLEDYEECTQFVLDYRTVQFSGYEVLGEGKYVTSVTVLSRNDTSDVYEVCYVTLSSVSGVIDINLLKEAEPTVENGIITHARKSIYSADSGRSYCLNFPAREVHDVLHVFGFAHSETPTFHSFYGWFFKDLRYFKDVMFPYPYCSYITEMNDIYGNCLEYIYSNGESGGGCGGVNFIS